MRRALPSKALPFAIAAIAATTTAASAAASPKLDELLKQLQSQERQLQNLAVVGEEWDEVNLTDGIGLWTRDKVGESASGWYDGMAGGPARIDVHDEVRPWVQGVAPYAQSSYVVAFDGKVGKRINLKAGPFGKTGEPGTGLVYPKMPADLPMAGFATGTLFSIFYQGGTATLSEFLRTYVPLVRSKAPSLAVDVVEEEYDRHPSYKIALLAPNNVEEDWWIDRDRGFGLLDYRHSYVEPDGRRICYLEIQVTDLAEVAPHLWYPREAYRYEAWYPSQTGRYVGPPRYKDQPRKRMHYKASSIVANDPHFDRKIFSPKFPAGFTITDLTNNKVYRVAPESPVVKRADSQPTTDH